MLIRATTNPDPSLYDLLLMPMLLEPPTQQTRNWHLARIVKSRRQGKRETKADRRKAGFLFADNS